MLKLLQKVKGHYKKKKNYILEFGKWYFASKLTNT